MNAISKRQRACYYMYKTQKNAKSFYTLFKKQDNFRYVFIYKKQDTFCYAIVCEFFKLSFIYKKHDTLCYVKFLNPKDQTIFKKKYIYIQKFGHFTFGNF